MAAADDAAETLDWLTNHAVLASAQAIASHALQIFDERGFLAAQASGQQHAQQILPGQRVHHLGRELAPPIHLGAVRVQQRLNGAGPFRGTGSESWRHKGLHERFLGFRSVGL